ncbi:hypothetical protein [Halorarius litoreus]|uniref:hypothetical protein n=1 Tax=Halorarius litoreus TaxID=2962676 RepID=UPI0020CCEEFD|nr:hypothetical protein [Halorarius litoreus]
MASEFRRPRSLAVARTVVYLAAGVALLFLFGVTLVFLVAMGTLGVVSVALFESGNALAVLGVGLSGLLVSGAVAYGVLSVTRRADHWLVAAARRSDPLEELAASYVEGTLDERTFERRVERVLEGGSETGGHSSMDRPRLGDEPPVTIRVGDDERIEGSGRDAEVR